MLVSDFEKGDRVKYVNPPSEVETGIVTSVNDRFVFVNYGSGDTSQATNPEHLQHV